MDCLIAVLRDQGLQFNCKISQSIFSFHNPSAFQATLSSGQTEPRLCWQCPNIPTFWSSGFFFAPAMPTHVVLLHRLFVIAILRGVDVLGGLVLWEFLCVSALFLLAHFCHFPCFAFYFSMSPFLPNVCSQK